MGVVGQSLRGVRGGGACSLPRIGRGGAGHQLQRRLARAASGCAPGIGCELGAARAGEAVPAVVQTEAMARGGFLPFPPVWIDPQLN